MEKRRKYCKETLPCAACEGDKSFSSHIGLMETGERISPRANNN